ncbi:hypothetical protein M406DRAFT_297286 [Cryphonectria parasitica EP155]|uniref:FAD-binding domain-containing protein n=1 Tax=Cryphonectria parasitica (strain ATCC 38755 / EP155) TaxID=660469 RepID=A0A9P4XSK3_CRYP1|nr:uncharacterized protein M406DRAFT_297286 [Cryphonectria parasitica EP155]KAF3759960.1 hypothetical protein M406DRAFT_297286 [Cryphonectria parasitica EP155]
MSFFTEYSSTHQFDRATDLHRHPLTGINVLIVGAGPVGLFTALECWRKGHTVVGVLERSPTPSAAGDSFTVLGAYIERSWPALFRSFEQDSVDLLISYHKITGEKVAGPEQFHLKEIANGRLDDDGTPGPSRLYRINRPLLAASMLAQAQELGIQVSFGKRVVDYFEEEEKAGVIFEDGSRQSADVVVSADGVGTKSHKLISGHEVRAMNSAHSIFRAAYPIEHVTADPELAERFPLLDNGYGHFEQWRGENLVIGVARFPKEMQWYITHKDTVGTSKESWHNFVTGEQVATFLSNFPEIPDVLKKLVRTAPKDSVVDWQLLWRDPQPTWSSPLGRVVQAGDSAHTFVPSSGSGVNQGLEDAISIATCLQLGGGTIKTGMWAKVHNKLRFERVSCCQLMGFINQSHFLKPEWGTNVLADPKNYRPEYGWWVLRHNPERYAYVNYGNAFRNLVDGTPFQNTNIPPGYVYKPWTLKDIYDTLAEGKKLKFDGDWS